MIKHVILWKLDDKISAEELPTIKKNMKEQLESLVGKVPGLVEMKIQIEGLATSTADIMLDSTLESEDALKAYATHPDHVHVADTYVRPYTAVRMCLDYEM